MTCEVIVSVSAGETRLLLTENGADIELFHDRATGWPGLGMIVEGRVAEERPDLGGAFIDLGRGVSGFLPRRAGPGESAVTPGARLALRVTRAAQGGKGPRLTARLGLPEGLTLAEWRALEPDPAVLFVAGLNPPAGNILADDPQWAANCAGYLTGAGLPPVPIALDKDGAAARRLDEAVDAALSPTIALPGGGDIHFADTRACTTIDVDSGAARRPALAVNLAAAPAIARALRLRGVGGLIVIDFIDMARKTERKSVEAALRHAMKADRERGEVLAISRLGLLEMSRTRRGPGLSELYQRGAGGLTPEAAALGALRRVEAAIGHCRSPALRVTVAREIADWLAQHPDIVAQAGARWLKPVKWQADAHRAVDDIEIEDR